MWFAMRLLDESDPSEFAADNPDYLTLGLRVSVWRTPVGEDKLPLGKTAQIVHSLDQTPHDRTGGGFSVTGMFQDDDEGEAGMVGRGVTGEPSVVGLVFAGLGGPRFARDGNIGGFDGGVGSAFGIGDRAAEAGANGVDHVGGQAGDRV